MVGEVADAGRFYRGGSAVLHGDVTRRRSHLVGR